MDFIELNLISGYRMCVRKDLVLQVFDLCFITKDMVKERPFLKDLDSCTMVQLSIEKEGYYCVDTYESIIQQLKEQ